MGRSKDDNYRSKTVGRDEMERTGGKLLKKKKSWACFCHVWREEYENEGRGSLKKAIEFLEILEIKSWKSRLLQSAIKFITSF